MKRINSYKLCNHLGNVLTVVSDRKIAVDNNADNVVDYFIADIISTNDYYVFGSPMPGRQFNTGDYDYGFNGKRMDNEMYGTGNSYDFGARIYDPRLGRWLATDPLQMKYPSLSPYHFGYNSPIITIDPDGKENIVVTGGEYTSDTRYKYNFVESAIKQMKDYPFARICSGG